MRKQKGMPAPTGATPAPDKGIVGIMLTGGAKQAAAVNPRELGPEVHGEAGRSQSAIVQAKSGIKAIHHGKGVS